MAIQSKKKTSINILKSPGTHGKKLSHNRIIWTCYYRYFKFNWRSTIERHFRIQLCYDRGQKLPHTIQTHSFLWWEANWILKDKRKIDRKREDKICELTLSWSETVTCHCCHFFMFFSFYCLKMNSTYATISKKVSCCGGGGIHFKYTESLVLGNSVFTSRFRYVFVVRFWFDDTTITCFVYILLPSMINCHWMNFENDFYSCY